MTFYEYFILSCYKTNYPMRISTLYHLLKGKRTSSILSYGYFYENLLYFGLLPKLREDSYSKTIERLMSDGLLKKIDSGVAQISETGLIELEKAVFPCVSNLSQLSFYKYDLLFWNKLLFVTQITSEKSHGQRNYIPIENNIFKQQQLKFWLKKQSKTIEMNFYEEWNLMLDYIPEAKQILLVGQLIGHNETGFTLSQIAEKQEQDYFFTYLEFKNFLHYFIQVVENERKSFPLFFELLELEKSLIKIDSSQISNQLFNQYKSIVEVSNQRNLKVSTITDHLIESFLLNPDRLEIPDFRQATLTSLNVMKQGNRDFRRWQYKDAKDYDPDLSFYEFKFFQFYLIEKEKTNA